MASRSKICLLWDWLLPEKFDGDSLASETGWGAQRLDFTAGTIEFKNDEFGGAYSLTASNFQNPKLHFSFSIDKGDWDFEVDFEGSINGDILEGIFYPGETPVQGKKILP